MGKALRYWAVVDASGEVAGEFYFHKKHAAEDLEDLPGGGGRLVCFVPQEPGEADSELERVIADLNEKIDLANERTEECDKIIEDCDHFMNVACANAFDTERHNQHNQTHGMCGFCGKQDLRRADEIPAHIRECPHHPLAALLRGVASVRNGDYGALPLAVLAKLNELVIQAGGK